jgi:hypothetical protein
MKTQVYSKPKTTEQDTKTSYYVSEDRRYKPLIDFKEQKNRSIIEPSIDSFDKEAISLPPRQTH